jgi:ubiquinol-cytochrome c reductase iron-sulfur subunit
VLEDGFIKFDLNILKPGIPLTVMWRGKPIFILKKTNKMISSFRDFIIGKNHYTVVIYLCTHLGCIPAWKKNQWKCACHDGIFNDSGKNIFDPFKVKGNIL